MIRKQDKKKIMLLAALVAVIVVGILGYCIVRAIHSHDQKEEIVSKVAQLMMVPSNETPVLATVVDIEELKKEQAFFIDSENGDKVLIYPQNAKAIIYRPSSNRIINVGPLYLNNASSTSPHS